MHSVLRLLTTQAQGGPIQITQAQDEVTRENAARKRWMGMGMNGRRCY